MKWWGWALAWLALAVALGPFFGRLLERRRRELEADQARLEEEARNDGR